jgi:hypothetical protein
MRGLLKRLHGLSRFDTSRAPGLNGAMLPPADHLALRATVIAGETARDDYQVIWSELPIGRIMRQAGMPPGRPSWSWSIIFTHRPQLAWHKGFGVDLEDAKKLFRLAWSTVHRELTQADVDVEKAQDRADADRPWRRRPR